MPQPAATPVPTPPEGLSPIAMTQPPAEDTVANTPMPAVMLSALPTTQAAPAAAVEQPAAVNVAATLPVFPADPAMQSLLQQLCTSQRTSGQQFHLLYTPADQTPQVETFDTCPALVLRMIELLGQPCFLHAFLGHYLPMTPGPLRHLRTPFGFMPLFTIPTAAAMGEGDGWAGTAPRPEARQIQIDATNQETSPGELNIPPPTFPEPSVIHPSVTLHDTPIFPGAAPTGG